jgi:hypothetical protein
MHEIIKEKRERRALKNVGVLLPFLPKFLFRSSITFLRFKRRAKKAGKVFRQELIKQGVDKHTASGLTGFYLKSSQIKNFIQTFR